MLFALSYESFLLFSFLYAKVHIVFGSDDWCRLDTNRIFFLGFKNPKRLSGSFNLSFSIFVIYSFWNSYDFLAEKWVFEVMFCFVVRKGAENCANRTGSSLSLSLSLSLSPFNWSINVCFLGLSASFQWRLAQSFSLSLLGSFFPPSQTIVLPFSSLLTRPFPWSLFSHLLILSLTAESLYLSQSVHPENWQLQGAHPLSLRHNNNS